VLLPERLHPGVARLVELGGAGEHVLQRGLEVAAHEVLHDEALPVLQRPEPLRVEVVHDAEPAHLGDRREEPRDVLLREVAHGDGEPVRRGVRGRQRRPRAAERLQAQIRLLELDRAALDRDELGRAALLVLEAAVAHRRLRDLEPGADAVHRLEGGELLLVHEVDEVPALRVLVEAPGLRDLEVLRPLLEPHDALP
jgi:hypothetical protein